MENHVIETKFFDKSFHLGKIRPISNNMDSDTFIFDQQSRGLDQRLHVLGLSNIPGKNEIVYPRAMKVNGTFFKEKRLSKLHKQANLVRAN
ncbi:MAG: hypothetical protein BWY68_00901 [bacterium ADurb.Bin400]|nr:MAG: hypothetical protein BWY68_00901 [bacterium ADurb.Bin400]